MKIAVALHIFYDDMWEEIKEKLLNITQPYKLYVNLVEGYTDTSIIEKIKEFKNDSIIVINENRGVAIGGFLRLFKVIDSDTDLLLTLHTKKSIGLENKPSDMVRVYGYENAIVRGKEWFNKIINGLLNDKNQVNEIISKFENDINCGMIGYDNKETFIGANENILIDMIKLFNLKEETINSNFVDGAMFWVRYDIIRKYFTNEIIDFILKITPKGYLNEPSINHSIERIFGYIIKNEGKLIEVI
jgi:lipopolysaccharide biosynthesis protein